MIQHDFLLRTATAHMENNNFIKTDKIHLKI